MLTYSVPSGTTVPSTFPFLNQYTICENTIYGPGFIPNPPFPYLLRILSTGPVFIALLEGCLCHGRLFPVFLFVKLVHVFGTVISGCSVFHS